MEVRVLWKSTCVLPHIKTPSQLWFFVFTAMILLELLMSFWNLFVKPVRRTRIPAYPHTRISAYPHIRIPAYPHIRIPAYPHTRISAYPHTRISAYPHTRISAYPRFPPNLYGSPLSYIRYIYDLKKVETHQLYTIYNMSGRVLSDIQTRAEGESCMYVSDATLIDANVVNGSLWNSPILWTYWRSNFENTSYINLKEKIKVNVYANQVRA